MRDKITIRPPNIGSSNGNIVSMEQARQSGNEYVITTEDLSYYVESKLIIGGVNISFKRNSVTAIIGPSGSGKTTLLRTLNRMNESLPKVSLEGNIYFHGRNIKDINECVLRSHVGMVFQKPTVFSKSIFENVIFGLRRQTKKSVQEYREIVEQKLRDVYLWKEVKERLDSSATDLSVGQQQRLCIARALALEPQVILMDEPTSALDPQSTEAIQKLIRDLSATRTVIFVTHNLNMAKKVGDYVVFVCNGKVCETGRINDFFTNPCMDESREYINAK